MSDGGGLESFPRGLWSVAGIRKAFQGGVRLYEGAGRRHRSPSCRPLWVATVLVFNFQGRLVGRAIAAHLRPIASKGSTKSRPPPLENPPNLHPPPQTPLENSPSLRHRSSNLQKTKQFRRNAQLVPAKQRTQPITNAIRERSDRTKRERSDRTKSKRSAANQKGSQAKRSNRTSDLAKRGRSVLGWWPAENERRE